MAGAQVQATEETDLTTRLSLLIGQSFFLGLSLGLLIVAAIALVLPRYGASVLPWVYIAVALAGSCAFYGFAEAQRRWSLIQVSLAAELTVVVFLVTTWAGLVYAQANWLAFAAMVVFSLLIQIGFVIVGGQAGRLLDVRQIKRYFPRIVAGFVVGFMVSGAVVGPLQRSLGRTEHLFLTAAGAATVMLGMLLTTNLRYHGILAQATPSGPQLKPRPLRQVLAKRFILLIFAYQMLSAMATQLLDFMVMAAAGERFTDSDALASFFGTFTFVLNLSDLLFLALVAGLLLSRFGLKFGLTFNPGAVILLLGLIVAVGVTMGPMTPLFFGLVLAARVMDITFTDGATRTSINATYQALPAHERVSVQTGVEGVGVPLALGLTGVVLLLFAALGNVTLMHIAAFALVISVFWTIAAVLVYRDYAANLLKTMRRRALGPAGLTFDDASLAVVERLVAGGKLSDIRLALDVLEAADHPALAGHLSALVTSASAEIQVEALARIERGKVRAALPWVQRLSVDGADPRVQGVALQARCALEEAEIVEDVVGYLDASQPDVRLGAAVGLLRYGSTPGILAVGTWLPVWAGSTDVADRRFLARVIGATRERHFYQPLLSLLGDPDARVRRAALIAAGSVRHPRSLPSLLDNLAVPETRSAASEALVDYGDLMLPLVAEALEQGGTSTENTVRLVRACLQVKGDAVASLMRHHLQHPQDAVRDQILAVLSACRYRAQVDELVAVDEALLRDVRRGHRLLRAQKEVGESTATTMLQRALQDEMTQVRRRILWLLSFLYESESILRAGFRLVQGTRAEQALALEMLDVTLASTHKALTFPLIAPRLDVAQRLQQLDRQLEAPTMTCTERLQELARDPELPWIRACALYAGAQLGDARLAHSAEAALADADPLVRETAAWCLYRLAPAQFSQHAAALMADKDARVAHVSATLFETVPPPAPNP